MIEEKRNKNRTEIYFTVVTAVFLFCVRTKQKKNDFLSPVPLFIEQEPSTAAGQVRINRPRRQRPTDGAGVPRLRSARSTIPPLTPTNHRPAGAAVTNIATTARSGSSSSGGVRPSPYGHCPGQLVFVVVRCSRPRFRVARVLPC